MKKRIFLCCLAAIIFFGCKENGKKGTKGQVIAEMDKKTEAYSAYMMKVLEYNQAIGK
ncbi:MAG: hypothetical protein LIR31_06185 [Bacteroidota bacterium]|nr:hypothetical protein [Bacteroidota bacterium]